MKFSELKIKFCVDVTHTVSNAKIGYITFITIAHFKFYKFEIKKKITRIKPIPINQSLVFLVNLNHINSNRIFVYNCSAIETIMFFNNTSS